MKIGMSLACFYPEHPEDAIDRACDLGVDIAELFLNTVSELEDEYINDFIKKCDRRGLEIYSIHPFTSALENYMFFSPYDRRINDSIKFYERYCDVAMRLGAKVINIHGDRGIGLKDPEKYFECILPLAELSDKTGITMSFENVFFNSVNHPDFIKKLRSRFGETIKFTFDIKQANKGGSDPYFVCEAMGSNVVNFHVNDYDADHICLLPGNGSVDHGRIIKTLLSNGYRGPALIEVYRDNFKSDEEISRSILYLKEVVSQLF